MSISCQTETNWMDELDSKLRNLEELEAARAKEAWEKHVVSTHSRHFVEENFETFRDPTRKILELSLIHKGKFGNFP